MSLLYNFLFYEGADIPEKLVIIPDAEIAGLPFDLLRTESGTLIEDHQISYAYHNDQLLNDHITRKNHNVLCLLRFYDDAPIPDLRNSRNLTYALKYAKQEVDRGF